MKTVDTSGYPRTAFRVGYTAAENELRQTFQTAEPVAALEIGLARKGHPGSLVVSIGPCTVTVHTPNVTSTDLRTPTWVAITLPQVLGPNAYTVTVKAEVTNTANYYLWTVDSGNPYPGGHLFKGEKPYTAYDAFLRVHNTPLGAPPVEPPVEPPPGPEGPPEPPAPEPNTVVKVTALTGIGHAYDVVVEGPHAYVATDSGLVIVDVTQPWAPTVLGTLVIRAGTAACYAVVTLPGERVALLGNGTATLYLIDVANPTAPKLEGAVQLGSNYWALAAHGGGQVVYVGNWSGVLGIIDVSGATPVLRKQLGLREWRPGPEDELRLQELEQEQRQAGAKITGLTVRGNTLAVTGWGYGRAYFFDVTDPLNPDFVSTHFAGYMYKTVMYGEDRASASAGYGRFSGVESFPIPARSSKYAYDTVSPGDCADCDFIPSHPNNWDIGSGICVAPGGRYLVATGGRSDGVLMILKTQLESNPTLVTQIAPGPLGSHRLAAPLGVTTVGEEYILAARGSAGLVVLRFPGLATALPPVHLPIDPPIEPPVEPPVVEFPPTDNPYGIVGYAAAVVGGYGKPTVVVTQPGDTGTGSLREALSLGGRNVIFDLPPDQRVITLDSPLPVRAETTIDGYPGIWLRRRPNLAGLHEGFGGLVIRGPHHEGAHDVVVRHIGIRGSAYDGFQIWEAYNVALDHCSAYEWIDGGCDITGPGCHHITVSNSIFAGSDLARWVPENGGTGHDFPSLIKYGAWEVTLYRNLYTDGTQRNPQFRLNVAPPVPQGRAHLQMTNCLVHYRGHGLYAIQDGACVPPECSKINLIKNYYTLVPGTAAKATHWALIDLKTQVYLEGNVGPKNTPPLRAPTYPERHPAPALEELEALEAAHAVLTSSGPAYRDAIDAQLIATAGQTVPGWGDAARAG